MLLRGYSVVVTRPFANTEALLQKNSRPFESVFKVKTLPKIKVRYRSGNCHFEVCNLVLLEKYSFTESGSKQGYRGDFIDTDFFHAPSLRGPPALLPI